MILSSLRILGLSVVPLLLGAGSAFAESASFSNTTPIVLSDGVGATKGSPYPSTITVDGMSGTIYKLTVTLTGITHTFPDDLDIMLVAPNGFQSTIFSDSGGNNPIDGITVVLDDSAVRPLPESEPITGGSYRPGNGPGTDFFSAPAPQPNGISNLSTFANASPNGIWRLYVMDDSAGDVGSISGWTLNITTATTAVRGELLISEFRLRGTNAALDEFVEIHNATDADHVVKSFDGSAGYALAASDGVTRFVIPNGTVIPPRGHFLGVNPGGYSLSNYPAGSGVTATGNATFTTDIPDNAGLALFRTSSAGAFNGANRLDAVGFTSMPNSLYKEGTGIPAITAFSVDHSFHRRLATGTSQDTDNNAADFLFVDTNGTSAGAGKLLGAPGPENLSSPARLRTGAFPLIRGLVDPGVGFNVFPNRVRDPLADSPNNSPFGTIDLRRKFTNATHGDLTRLRFRVVDISTFPAVVGAADLRVRTCGDTAVSLFNGGNVVVRGTTLETPPVQPSGGGVNSTLSLNLVTTAKPLLSGASVDVRFLFGIQQTGAFRLAIVPETLPASVTGVWILSGDTQTASLDVETLPMTAITRVRRQNPDVLINYTTSPGVRFRLQRSPDLINWSNVGLSISGSGTVQSRNDAGAGVAGRQFYRLRQEP